MLKTVLNNKRKKNKSFFSYDDINSSFDALELFILLFLYNLNI